MKAELWDRIQYLFRNYYDRMLHGYFEVEGHLNEKNIEETIRIVLEKIPVLRSKYVANIIKPYWKVVKGDFAADVLSIVECDDIEKGAEEFLTGCFGSAKAPQMKVRICRGKKNDTIAFLINHQCFDGGDLKEFLYKFIEIYSVLEEGGDGYAVEVKNGTRSNDQVYSTMADERRKRAKGLYKNQSITEHPLKFPFSSNKKKQKAMIVKRFVEAEHFDKMKAFGKEHGATINDILLAAYFRTMFRLITVEEGQTLTIPCFTNLRKYIEGGQTEGFTNLTCMITCTIDSVGDSFEETLKKVSAEMLKTKNDDTAGLAGIPLLKLAYNIAPAFISELLIKIGYTNPFIGMSNIGIIDHNRISWGKLPTADAYLSGAIKYKPYMQLAVTSLMKRITMTICIYGTDEDRAVLEKFFKIFEEEISVTYQ